MKKGYLVPILTLIWILACTLWMGVSVASHANRWNDQLQTADRLAQQADWAGATSTLSSSYTDWKSHQNWLRLVTRHDIVDAAEAMYHRAMAFALTQESSEFRAEIADLQTQIHLLAETERVSLQNIL